MGDPVSDLKRELIAAAERQQPMRAQRGRSCGDYLGRNRLPLAAATLVIAVTASLIVSAPWDTSPGFLARAEAALRPPGGVVLHQKWVATTTSAEFPGARSRIARARSGSTRRHRTGTASC